MREDGTDIDASMCCSVFRNKVDGFKEWTYKTGFWDWRSF